MFITNAQKTASIPIDHMFRYRNTIGAACPFSVRKYGTPYTVRPSVFNSSVSWHVFHLHPRQKNNSIEANKERIKPLEADTLHTMNLALGRGIASVFL